MADHFSIDIPTKAFLKQYLFALYGDPLIFKSDHFFGMVLAACIEKNVYKDRSKQQLTHRFDSFSENITIYFPSHWLRNYYHGNGISNEKAIFINKFLEERFEEDLYRYCFMLDLAGVQRKDAIEDFCRHYHLEIDLHITFENLKKMEYRFRKKIQINPLDSSRQKTTTVSPLLF